MPTNKGYDFSNMNSFLQVKPQCSHCPYAAICASRRDFLRRNRANNNSHTKTNIDMDIYCKCLIPNVMKAWGSLVGGSGGYVLRNMTRGNNRL